MHQALALQLLESHVWGSGTQMAAAAEDLLEVVYAIDREEQEAQEEREDDTERARDGDGTDTETDANTDKLSPELQAFYDTFLEPDCQSPQWTHTPVSGGRERRQAKRGRERQSDKEPPLRRTTAEQLSEGDNAAAAVTLAESAESETATNTAGGAIFRLVSDGDEELLLPRPPEPLGDIPIPAYESDLGMVPPDDAGGIAEEALPSTAGNTPDDAGAAPLREPERTVAWRRRSVLAASPIIVGGLVKMLNGGDCDELLSACSVVAGLCQGHVENATLMGQATGLVTGLCRALGYGTKPSAAWTLPGGGGGGGGVAGPAGWGGFDEGISGQGGGAQAGAGGAGMEAIEVKEAASQALVHLAMQNRANKLNVVRCEGALESLRALLVDRAHPDLQDTAAMVIANCADNFAAGGGAEAARAIVDTPGMLAALRNLVEESVLSFTDSADRSAGLAAVISLSDHEELRAELRAAGISRALQCMLQCNCRGAEYDSMRAEALMAAVNLAENADTVRGDAGVLRTVVHLSECAVIGQRGEGQAPIWAVRECLRPLVSLSVGRLGVFCGNARRESACGV